MAAKTKTKRGSIKPSEAHPTGFLDGEVVTLSSHLFVLYDYDGTVDPPAFGMMVVMEQEDGEERNQFYSGGRGAVPSADGEEPADEGAFWIPDENSKHDTLAQGTKLMKYIESAIEAGIDEDDFDDGDISILDGKVAMMKTVKSPRRDDKDATVLVIDSFVDDDKPAKTSKKSSKKTASKGKKEEEPAADDSEWDDDFAGEVIEFIEAAIRKTETEDAWGRVEADELAPMVNKKYKNAKQKSQAFAMVTNQEFLSGETYEVPWTYDGDGLTIEEE